MASQYKDRLYQVIAAQAERTPDGIAAMSGAEVMTYRDLNLRANQLAHALRATGVKPGMRVGLCLEHGFDLMIAVLGILKAGGVCVPMDPKYPAARFEFLLADMQPILTITQQSLRERLSTASQLMTFDTDAAWLASQPTHNPADLVSGQAPAFIFYTSGTTGRPKGVIQNHDELSVAYTWFEVYYDITPQDCGILKSACNLVGFRGEMLSMLISGARTVIVDPTLRNDIEHLADLILRHGITLIRLTPSMLRVLLDSPRIHQCESLRHVVCAGEPLPRDLEERFFSCLRATLHVGYGATEAPGAAYRICRPDDPHAEYRIGRPTSVSRIHILSPDLQPVSQGAVGEICIGGPIVSQGYWNRPELTAERFIRNPLSSGSDDRLYRTGDWGRELDDGQIVYLGRADMQANLRGMRLDLNEIEASLLRHPQASAVAVLVREDQPGDQRLVAYLTLSSADRPPRASALREFLAETLPESMVPEHFVFLQQFPIAASGKVDRDALPAPGREPPSDRRMSTASIADLITQLRQLGVILSLKDDNLTCQAPEGVLTLALLETLKARMAGHFFTLLKGLVAEPDRSIAEIPLMSADEQRQLSTWNRTETARDRDDPVRLYKKTGDHARWRADGNLEFLDRFDQQIKLRGFRIEPGEIEAVLLQQPDVRQAAVVLREDRPGDPRLAAYLVTDSDDPIDPDALRQAPAERLPGYMLPSAFAILESLPLTPNGKLDRHALPIPAGPDRMPQDPLSAAPRTPLEARLVSLWQDVLGLVDPPGIHDDFFDLGGHSLLAARLVQVIETDLRTRLPLAALFRFSTIAQLAERFSEQAPESAPTEQRPPSVLATTLQETVYRALLTFHAGRKHPRLAPDSLLMRLNPEASGTPLYFCGIFEALAAALPHRPIIAMDSGLYAMAITDANVQALAKHYFEEIQARQLSGPFVLIGFSLGAQVAFELARFLMSGGHAVTLLGLIDKSIEHPYPGRVAQFIADQGPFRHLPDSDTWRQDCAQHFPGGMSLDRIPGNHTSILRQGAVAHLLAERIEARLAQLTATAVPLSAEARRLTWQAPAKLVYAMDETASLLLVLTNASPRAWGNDHALSVGYHWYDDYARLVQWAVDTVPLSLPIDAGQSVSLSIPVVAPGRPGRYRLVVDLLDRAESWGMLSGLETAAVAVEILPASQPKCLRATDLDEARLAWQEGRDQDTMRLCQPLLTAHDQAPLQVFQQLALALQRWGRLEASLDVCQRGLTAYPNDAQLSRLCAEVALGLDQPNLAVEHARRAAELEPARPVHWALLGQACAKRGDDAQAIDAYRRALAQRADIDWRKGLAECLERTGHFLEAATEWRHAIALRPGQLTFSVRLARALRQAGQPDAALDVCRQLLDQDPGHLESHLFIMDGLRELGRAAEALALYDAASPRLKPSARLQQARGDCLIALERTEEALAAFRRGTEIDPAFAGNWLKLADIWLQQPSIEAAEQALDSALGHHPDDARFLFRRGQLLLDQGHEESEALAMFDRVIAQQPTHFRAHWRRAEALVKLNRWTEAEAAYRCAAAINPRHGPVRQGLVRVGEQLNALETAR